MKGDGNEYQLSDLIETALRRYNFDESVTRSQVEEAYRQVVGDFINRLTWAVRFDVATHTLKVHIASPALKRELSFKNSDLIMAINNQLGSNAVEKLVLL